MEEKEVEELKIRYDRRDYEKSAKKYRPDKIKYLLIAESPPHKLTNTGKKKYLYIETVTEGDTLLINTIKSRYSVERYKGSEKKDWLKRLQNDGFFLMDAVEYPINQFVEKERNVHIKANYRNLLKRLEKLREDQIIDDHTNVILIKRNIFEILAEKLKDLGYNVLNENTV